MAHVIQAGHLVRIPDRAQGRAANLSRSSPCSSADRASASGAVCTGSSPVRGASRRRASAQFRAFSAQPKSPGFPQFPAGARCAWTGLGQEPGHGVSTISSSRKHFRHPPLPFDARYRSMVRTGWRMGFNLTENHLRIWDHPGGAPCRTRWADVPYEDLDGYLDHDGPYWAFVGNRSPT